MIYEILQQIQNELKAPKGQYNSFGGYSYRNCEDILEALKPLLAPHKGTIVCTDDLVMIGNRYYVKATVTLRIGEETVSTTAFAREEETKKGMDGSQVTGASSSYARKYALNGLFAIDDNKDSDTTNKGSDGEKNEPLTYEAATNHVLSFGQHKGKTIREVWTSDLQYIKWLEEREETDDKTRAAIARVREEIANQKKQKQGDTQ